MASTLLLGIVAFAGVLSAFTFQAGSYSVLADSELQRRKNELQRVRTLVENGTLPRTKLTEAEERVADAEDQDVLARTLYGATPVENMTAEAGAGMKAAAEKRIARQQRIVESRRTLLEGGIVARTEVEAAEAELQSRQQVLDLVTTRLRLLDDLRKMAESERAAERLAGSGLPNMQEAIARGAVIRFNGTATFVTSQLSRLSALYAKKFGQALPVSAVGETAVHRAMGLDHRNRVDVALNPDSAQGLWFRQLLERLKLPYLAFRSAVAGAATAPHIHIGLGSARLLSNPRTTGPGSSAPYEEQAIPALTGSVGVPFRSCLVRCSQEPHNRLSLRCRGDARPRTANPDFQRTNSEKGMRDGQTN